MKRKVIKQGHNTLTITLPSKWVEKNQIAAGDELNISESGSTLSISTDAANNNGSNKREYDLGQSVTCLDRSLGSMYKKGYDEIIITATNASGMKNVQQILSDSLIGFEIVAQSQKSCTIKSIAEAQYSEFDAVLRRTILLLCSMGEAIDEALTHGDMNSIPNIKYMEKTNNRYTGFLRRVINKGKYMDYKNEKLMYCFVEFLEKIADEYKYLCIYFEDNPKAIKEMDKEIKGLHKEFLAFMRSSLNLFYKYDEAQFSDLYVCRKSIIKNCKAMLLKSHGRNSLIVHHIMTMSQQVADILAFTQTMHS